jgi:hypothetical protein
MPDRFELTLDCLGPRTRCVGSVTRQKLKDMAVAGDHNDLDICSAEIDTD